MAESNPDWPLEAPMWQLQLDSASPATNEQKHDRCEGLGLVYQLQHFIQNTDMSLAHVSSAHYCQTQETTAGNYISNSARWRGSSVSSKPPIILTCSARVRCQLWTNENTMWSTGWQLGWQVTNTVTQPWHPTGQLTEVSLFATQAQTKQLSVHSCARSVTTKPRS